MPAEIPTTEPTSIRAGDTIKWKIGSNEDYPIDEWVMIAHLVGAGGALHVSASVDGDYHLVTLTAAQTAALNSGSYEYSATMISGSEVYTVREGHIQIQANLSALASRINHVEKLLNAIAAVLEDRVTADVAQYSIGTRSITKIPIPELMRLRATYARELYQLKAKSNGKTGFGNDIQVQFTRV